MAAAAAAPAPPAMGSPNREGVVVAEGLVIAGLGDSRVIALREATGELVWNQYVGDKARDKGQVISAAPVYAGGIVSVGLSADNGWRGQIVGLDAKTGREVWRWFAVPAPGEPGSESWPKTAQWKFGGGAMWLVGAADPDAGLVYYVTGNGVPQLSGEFRTGDNLYLCSIVALDMKTGKLKWHFQTIRHDIWEADMSISPVLFEAQVDGRPRKAVAGIRPDGYLFILDRETGKPLQKIEDRAVPQDAFQKTASKQPYPVGFESPLNDCDWWRKQRIPAVSRWAATTRPSRPRSRTCCSRTTGCGSRRCPTARRRATSMRSASGPSAGCGAPRIRTSSATRSATGCPGSTT